MGLLRQVVNKVCGTRNMDDMLLRPPRSCGPYREVPVCFMEGWSTDQVLDLHIHWQNFRSVKRRGLSMWLKKRHHLQLLMVMVVDFDMTILESLFRILK
ncbi:uncharacterized protein G2W53_015627 [Senna tora]|uniref:Uncharacterized protein n=1 Tax=Senna tora TaxID=362788 RepID=A0A835C5X0_9FABA|nr:uncharacterized protein G2W53_015627 [Senna tora]